MARAILHNCVDEVSAKGLKHVEHRSAVAKLLPLEQRRALEALQADLEK